MFCNFLVPPPLRECAYPKLIKVAGVKGDRVFDLGFKGDGFHMSVAVLMMRGPKKVLRLKREFRLKGRVSSAFKKKF